MYIVKDLHQNVFYTTVFKYNGYLAVLWNVFAFIIGNVMNKLHSILYLWLILKKYLVHKCMHC